MTIQAVQIPSESGQHHVHVALYGSFCVGLSTIGGGLWVHMMGERQLWDRYGVPVTGGDSRTFIVARSGDEIPSLSIGSFETCGTVVVKGETVTVLRRVQ